jgi:hypothetical protein
MDGIWNRCNLKITGRIYTFGVLKYSEKFKVLDLPKYIGKLMILKTLDRKSTRLNSSHVDW